MSSFTLCPFGPSSACLLNFVNILNFLKVSQQFLCFKIVSLFTALSLSRKTQNGLVLEFLLDIHSLDRKRERSLDGIRLTEQGLFPLFYTEHHYISVHNFVMEAMASNRMWSFMNF